MTNKTKYTKAQEAAIQRLVLDLNELDNKSGRLLGALENFAIAFDKRQALPAIYEGMDRYLNPLFGGDEYNHLFWALQKYKKEEYEWWVSRQGVDQKENSDDYEKTQTRICGVEDFIKTFIKVKNDINRY